MRKSAIFVLIIAILVSMLSGCSNENLTNRDEISFIAKILQIDGDIVTVSPMERDGSLRPSDKITFNVKDLNDIGASVGDTVNVSYDGIIADSYPGIVNACSWSIVNKADDQVIVPPAPNTRQPSIMVNDTYYFITGLSASIEIDENDYLGVVTSIVPLSQIPTMNGQSNFVLEGTPYAEYEDGIVALIDGKWVIFELWDDELVNAYVDH